VEQAGEKVWLGSRSTSGRAECDQQANAATYQRDNERFQKELPEDAVGGAPMALRTPISRVRSRTATSITFITPKPLKTSYNSDAPRNTSCVVMVRKAFAS